MKIFLLSFKIFHFVILRDRKGKKESREEEWEWVRVVAKFSLIATREKIVPHVQLSSSGKLAGNKGANAGIHIITNDIYFEEGFLAT